MLSSPPCRQLSSTQPSSGCSMSAAQEGRDPRGHDLPGLHPHRRRRRARRRRGDRPDRQVPGLRDRAARTTILEPIVCLVSGANRVDLARLAAVIGRRDVRRATAQRGRRAHRLHDRRDPAVRPPAADPRDHGPGPRSVRDRLGRRRPADRRLPGLAGHAADARRCPRRPDRRGAAGRARVLTAAGRAATTRPIATPAASGRAGGGAARARPPRCSRCRRSAAAGRSRAEVAAEPGRAVPRRAAGRWPGGRMDGPLRLDAQRRAGRAAVGHRRASWS